jgi:O-antigen chain-terminating methyltransferase
MREAEPPGIDVAELMKTVRSEVRLRRQQLGPSESPAPALDLSRILDILELAEQKTTPRSRLPRVLNRFPFNRVRLLERLVLKAYDSVTHDQRLATLYLVESLRETLELNRTLHRRIVQLEAGRRKAAELPDDVYVQLEERFRGSRDLIKQRVSVYLPVLEAAGVGSNTAPILDVGCGRGEWLELLRDKGLRASGVDANRLMVGECAARGLDATETDAVAYLRSLAEGSLGAVTAFHLIEHLEPSTLLALVDEARRVLRPGGVVIFETPNPANLLVAAYNFYLDPTHRNPIPAETARFFLESRGFANVQLLFVNPPPDSWAVPDDGSEVTRHFNRYFYTAYDYGVIGYRA